MSKHILFLFLITIISCQKKAFKPTGQNIITYTIDNKSFEAKDKFSNWFNPNGIGYAEDSSIIYFGARTGHLYGDIEVVINKNTPIGQWVDFKPQYGLNVNVDYPINILRGFSPRQGSAQYKIITLTDEIIAGNFRGTLYEILPDSLITDTITTIDGYFDIKR